MGFEKEECMRALRGWGHRRMRETCLLADDAHAGKLIPRAGGWLAADDGTRRQMAQIYAAKRFGRVRSPPRARNRPDVQELRQ